MGILGDCLGVSVIYTQMYGNVCFSICFIKGVYIKIAADGTVQGVYFDAVFKLSHRRVCPIDSVQLGSSHEER